MGRLAPNARHAERVLRSEAPLLSMPDTEGGAFTVAALRLTMPEPLREVPNHYRHRLNACLQRERVDPELRHAQLGWVVTPAHALADLSPWSARLSVRHWLLRSTRSWFVTVGIRQPSAHRSGRGRACRASL